MTNGVGRIELIEHETNELGVRGFRSPTQLTNALAGRAETLGVGSL